ncbi:MAG: hypothetical protein AAB785_00875 [Patescibacteria group bacterium]
MPEQNEGGYQPSEQEVREAETKMNPEQNFLSNEKSIHFENKLRFIGPAEKFEAIMSLPKPERSSKILETMNDQELCELFGEGYPPDLTYHGWDALTDLAVAFGGLSGRPPKTYQGISFREVAPHSFNTTIGTTLPDRMKDWTKEGKLAYVKPYSEEHIVAAQNLVDIYLKFTSGIIEKSPKLQRLLEPLLPLAEEIARQKQSGEFSSIRGEVESNPENPINKIGETSVSQEALQLLRDELFVAFYKRDGTESDKVNLFSYSDGLEARFGRIFRAACVEMTDPDEFAEFKRGIIEAYDRLISAK